MKVAKIEENSLFPTQQIYSPKVYLFKACKLGRLRASLPLEDLALQLPSRKVNSTGPDPWFDNRGMIALMFLKHYLGLSDEKLIDRFNADWQMQLFCGRLLSDTDMVRDTGIVSRIRGYLSRHLDIDFTQQAIIDYWKPYMEDQQAVLFDATVYESHMKFPTHVKLLWDSCQYIYKNIEGICLELKLHKPRSKYLDHQKKQWSYQTRKRKGHKVRLRRRKALLKLLKKLTSQLQQLLDQHIDVLQLNKSFFQTLKLIRRVIPEQSYLINNPDSKLPDRILSLYKPYVRAIVRGKENKAVEYGAKVHIGQVDGINYIEHLSYRNFHEGIRLKISIVKHKQMFGQCHQIAADRIYATNKNRSYVTDKEIATNFIPKGKSRDKTSAREKLRKILGKERTTRLEGSFGNDKNHYTLRKVKARNLRNELIWIFFGIMTANAVRISKRIPKHSQASPMAA